MRCAIGEPILNCGPVLLRNKVTYEKGFDRLKRNCEKKIPNKLRLT
jgi:hypothetical protein